MHLLFGYAPAFEPVLARSSDVKPVTRSLTWGVYNASDPVGKPTTTLTLTLTLTPTLALCLALALALVLALALRLSLSQSLTPKP